ncbi:MAG: UvrB/UvrC motif-containing protein [Clostridiales bacterium]|nr:UvrB/UvrC motif-containing protein [Clostridiales bacterium]
MLCENCKKNQATTYLKTVISGEAREMRLCDECAKNFGGFNFFSSGFGLDGILSGLLGQYNTSQKKPAGINSCPVCGSTLEDFSESGRVGCANCYDVFYENLMPYIRRIHGSAVHSGRIPKRIESSPKRRIQALESELAQAVAAQEYERAAQIRDELKALKEGDQK